MPCDVEASREFLRSLYGGPWAGGDASRLVGVVGGPVGQQRWSVRTWRAVPAGLHALADDARRQGVNVFVNVNPMRPGVPRGKRGTAEDVVAQVAYVADIDYAAPGHKGEKRRPTCEGEVWEALEGDGVPMPTMAVSSGGGCHLYWVLSTPFLLDEDGLDRRADAAAAAGKWHRVVAAAMAGAGYDEPDNVSDLPRVLRVPGTWRTKAEAPDPLPVTILWADGDRYDREHLDGFAWARFADHEELSKEEAGKALSLLLGVEGELTKDVLVALAADPPEGPAWQTGTGIELGVTRSDVVGPRLAADIAADFAATLAEFSGPYVSGRYVKLRNLAVWAGAREAILGDNLKAVLLHAARAGGVTDRRGEDVVTDLIDTGLARGRQAPLRPPVLRSPQEPAPGAREAGPGPHADDEDGPTDHDEEPPRPKKRVGTLFGRDGRAEVWVVRQFREVEEDVVTALQALNGTPSGPWAFTGGGDSAGPPGSRSNGPVLFNRGGELVEVEGGRMRPVGEAGLASWASRAANFLAPGAKDKPPVAVHPPRAVLRSLAATDAGRLGMPMLDGLTAVPPIRPDGTVRTVPGYDPVTRLYYAPHDGIVAEVPEFPTAAEAEKALALLVETWAEFPYRDDASRAHGLALLLTAALRPAVAGPVPMAVVTASTPGTGKSLLAGSLLAVVTGEEVPAQLLTGSEEERRKLVTADLRNDGRVLFLDNLEGTLRSGVLSGLLTARRWKDRVLGSSATTDVPVRTTPVVTGNGVVLRGDLTRRTYWVELDAGLARPWLRSGFTHSDLMGHVLRARADLVGAVFTLARSWYAAGRPAPTCPRLGSYEAWRNVVGGILEYAGVKGFLANAAERIDDPDVGEWGAFVEALGQRYPATFTAAEVAGMLDAEPVTWRALIPSTLAAKVGRPDLAKSLGEAWAQRVERRWDDDGLRLERAGVNRQKVALWRVVRDERAPEGPVVPWEEVPSPLWETGAI